MIAWAVPCALGAAAAFAVANVVQMRAVRRTEAGEGLDPRLLARLATDPSWLLGLAASAAGYGLQASALYLAPVVVVQPLIVTELLFALPLAAAMYGQRLQRRDWGGTILVAGGLATLMLAADPSGQRTNVSGAAWATMTVAVGAVVALLVVVGERRRHRVVLRASALAAAASVCFGLMSVLTRTVSHQLGAEGLAAAVRPQPWLLAGFAFVGLLLAQTAFRIAPLAVSLPLIDLGEPLVGSLLAVTVFGDQLGTGPGVVAAVAAAALLVTGGVVLLDTSPLVRAAQHRVSTGAAADVALPASAADLRGRARSRRAELSAK